MEILEVGKRARILQNKMNDSFSTNNYFSDHEDCMNFRVDENGEWKASPQVRKKSRKTWLPREIKSVFSIWHVTFYLPDGVQIYTIDVDTAGEEPVFSQNQ